MRKVLIFLAVPLSVSLLIFSGVAFADSTDDFTDVPFTHRYHEAISWFQQNGIVQGYDDGSFRPDKEINRAEFLKIMHWAKEGGLPIPMEDVIIFKDVPYDAWYAFYVKDSYARGIIEGYVDATFRPDQTISLAEAVKIVMNTTFAKPDDETWKVEDMYKLHDDSSGCLSDLEKDLSQVIDKNAWFWKYIHFADVICSIPDELVWNKDAMLILDPDKKLTRGQMAELLYRTKAVADNSGFRNCVSNCGVDLGNYWIGMKPTDVVGETFCTDRPEILENGDKNFPIHPMYPHLGSLGQLFTASRCGSDRLMEIDGVENDKYLMHPQIFTISATSEKFLKILNNLGFHCPQAFLPEMCTNWILNKDVDVLEILKLEPYAEEIESDSCFDCD